MFTPVRLLSFDRVLSLPPDHCRSYRDLERQSGTCEVFSTKSNAFPLAIKFTPNLHKLTLIYPIRKDTFFKKASYPGRLHGSSLRRTTCFFQRTESVVIVIGDEGGLHYPVLHMLTRSYLICISRYLRSCFSGIDSKSWFFFCLPV